MRLKKINTYHFFSVSSRATNNQTWLRLCTNKSSVLKVVTIIYEQNSSKYVLYRALFPLQQRKNMVQNTLSHHPPLTFTGKRNDTLHGPSSTLTTSFTEMGFLDRSWANNFLSILDLISLNLTSTTSGRSGTPLSTWNMYDILHTDGPNIFTSSDS